MNTWKYKQYTQEEMYMLTKFTWTRIWKSIPFNLYGEKFQSLDRQKVTTHTHTHTHTHTPGTYMYKSTLEQFKYN